MSTPVSPAFFSVSIVTPHWFKVVPTVLTKAGILPWTLLAMLEPGATEP